MCLAAISLAVGGTATTASLIIEPTRAEAFPGGAKAAKCLIHCAAKGLRRGGSIFDPVARQVLSKKSMRAFSHNRMRFADELDRIAGLPDKALKSAAHEVEAFLRNCGLKPNEARDIANALRDAIGWLI